ncbi:MAG: DNA ligase D [Verrucomicrobiota bacterium]
MPPDLQTYRRKRDFARTHEPGGDGASGSRERVFVVQKHDARRLHFDFRLAIDGVLKSWAVPKGPSLDPEDKRLAIQVEDHPLEYGEFEGTIPEGEYGAGTVQLWDRGRFETRGDPAKELEKGHLHLTLEGEKLRGGFDLFRLKGRGRDQWLLKKRDDDEAREKDAEANRDEADESVRSGRSLAEIRRESASSASSEKPPSSRPEQMPAPQLATLADTLPTGRGWVYEVKWDGYRLLGQRASGKVRLWTRNGHDWSDRFPAIVEALGRLPGDDWIVDGEAVVLDARGRSDFAALQRALREKASSKIHYILFDLLRREGRDRRDETLRARKAELEEWLEEAGPPDPLRYSTHFAKGGRHLLATACANELEGLLAKKLEAPYASGRTSNWRKIKCAHRQEFAVVGYTAPQGGRRHFGALLLASHEDEAWRYRGKVGTGFGGDTLQAVARHLRPLERKTPVTLEPRPREKDVTWVRPALLAEISYANLTDDGLLRQAVFQGLREDKPAETATLEKPVRDPMPPSASKKRAKTSSKPTIEGVEISHPDRVVDPASGLTKADLAAYYAAVAEHALPYLHERPLSLVRCPQGRAKQCFFQKHFTGSAPPQTHTVDLPEKSGTGCYSYVTTAAGLVALAQYGTVELHGWGSRIDRPDTPDQITFDLDPGDDVPWKAVLGAAFMLRDVLAEEADLRSFVKWTGGKGLHVCVPLTRRASWETARPWAKAVADALVARAPKQLLAKASKAARKGRIFVDYLRNAPGATAIAPYSARARPGLTVALPLAWNALPDELPKWTIADVPGLLAARRVDPWRDYRRVRQSLTAQRLEAFGVET